MSTHSLQMPPACFTLAPSPHAQELLHHSQHELQSVTEALLASRSECKALQQALQQHQQQQQQTLLGPASGNLHPPGMQPSLDKGSPDALPPLPSHSGTHSTGKGGGDTQGAARLVAVQLTPAPAPAGRRWVAPSAAVAPAQGA